MEFKLFTGNSKLHELRRNNFKEWIKQFEGWNSPIGDLADDFKQDKSLGKNPTKAQIKSKIKWDRIGEVFELAWKVFKSKDFNK